VVVDYEAAWTELQGVIAGKSQHGREATLVEMAQIAGRHRVAAGEKSRLLRLYSIEVAQREAEMTTDPDTVGHLAAGFDSDADEHGPGHHDRGGHDGRSRESAGSQSRNGNG
jgi:hypothetical protein